MKTCDECRRKSKCKELCAYMESQMPQKESREMPIGIVRFLNFDEMWPELRSANERRLVYEMYFIDHMEIKDISFHVKLSEGKIYKLITRLKEGVPCWSMRKKDRILNLHFLKGKSLTESSRLVGVSKAYCHEIIQGYLKKMKLA